jgi:hypothetical protein
MKIEKMTVAEGLAELKRILNLLQKRYVNITNYCSKRRGSKDEIENQREFINSETQSALDLIKRYGLIKVAIEKSNTETSVTYKDTTMTIAEAIIFKRTMMTEYGKLFNSFRPDKGAAQINDFARLTGLNTRGTLEKETIEKLDLIAELYYDPKLVMKSVEDLNELYSHLDVLIDMSNHATSIFA